MSDLAQMVEDFLRCLDEQSAIHGYLPLEEIKTEPLQSPKKNEASRIVARSESWMVLTEGAGVPLQLILRPLGNGQKGYNLVGYRRRPDGQRKNSITLDELEQERAHGPTD